MLAAAPVRKVGGDAANYERSDSSPKRRKFHQQRKCPFCRDQFERLSHCLKQACEQGRVRWPGILIKPEFFHAFRFRRTPPTETNAFARQTRRPIVALHGGRGGDSRRLAAGRYVGCVRCSRGKYQRRASPEPASARHQCLAAACTCASTRSKCARQTDILSKLIRDAKKFQGVHRPLHPCVRT